LAAAGRELNGCGGEGEMSVASGLAEFLTGIGAADLPAQALDHAAMLVASTAASAAAGSGLQSAAIVRDLARERGGRAEASLWFDGGPKLPVGDAARVNAMMSDAAASDDSDLRNIVHCGTPLTAAALAIAERDGNNGTDVLTAIVAGYEAAGRIGAAITPGLRERGFHGSVAAVFAAAVAAARLLRLGPDQAAHAIALAATSIGGLMEAANTSVAREYHAGLATMLGIEAARAAQRGYTAELQILEMRDGFFEAFGGVDGGAAGAEAMRELGAEWDIVTDMAVKLVPGGHPYHALAEAAANAARAGNVAAAEVESITVSRPGLTALSGPLHPRDLIDMAHSPAYFLAAGAADHDFSWVHATPAKIADPSIHRLIDLVKVGPPPAGEEARRYRQGATVAIRTYGGASFTSTVYAPKGAGMLGIAWEDIEAKCRALLPLAGFTDERIAKIVTLTRDFRALDRVTPLIELLRP
jgi:2-methylcitrate dehydratase PrpD